MQKPSVYKVVSTFKMRRSARFALAGHRQALSEADEIHGSFTGTGRGAIWFGPG